MRAEQRCLESISQHGKRARLGSAIEMGAKRAWEWRLLDVFVAPSSHCALCSGVARRTEVQRGALRCTKTYCGAARRTEVH